MTKKQVIEVLNEESQRVLHHCPDMVSKAGFNKAPKPIYDYCLELNALWISASKKVRK